ncbi:MAG TPA: SusC/RagA family TonB-linked outer membrane protein [Longimicrobiales bacterium]
MRSFSVRSASIPILLLLLAAPAAWAQQASIRGTVLDERGQPLPGAAVIVRGTQIGAVVNNAGLYVVNVSPGTYELEARALGYRSVVETVMVSAGATETVNFTLEVSAIQLEQIVASVEAGEVTRRQMGVDITSIDVADQIDAAVVTNVSELLNARAANVTITEASGDVGAGSRIRVRGVNSLTQGNNPLIIIDGVRASNDTNTGINRGQTFSRFNDLDPNNIASIQVVKGPAALALYGSEAGSGVIIIETKTGRAAQDGMQISVQYQEGALWDVTDYPDNLADITPFVTGPDDPRLEGWRIEQHPLTGQIFVVDNPYEDESTSPFRTGRTRNGSLSVTGRSGSVSYFSSLSFDDQTGTLPSNDLSRINFRANFQATPNEKLSITASSGYVTSTINLPKSGNNTSGFYSNAVTGLPISSRNADGECLGALIAGTDDDFCDKDGNRLASFDKIAAIISREELERFTGSLRVNYTPFPWLTNAATVGADIIDQVFHDAIPYDPEVPFSFAAGGEYFRTRNLRRHVTADISSTASYDLTSSISASTAIGAQYFQSLREEIACEGRVFVNDQATACDAGVSLRGFSDLEEKIEIGAYVQQRLSYADYLFLTGALRIDDNSALGVEEPAILSPSFNTSLVVSDMPMWNVDPGLISELRLRGAWGTASKSPVQYAAERTYGVVRLGTPNGVVAGLSPENPGNPNLGPERSSEIEVGFDASVLQDRLGLQFTYFHRVTKDAIVDRPVPPSSGFAQDQWVNLGELKNVGYEVGINALLYDGDNVRWDATLTMSGTKATITDLGGEEAFSGFRVGYAPGSLESCVLTHAERDENGNIIPESLEHLPGTLGDGTCRRVVGQPTPTNEQSLLTTLNLFENLQISALFDRAAGHILPSGFLSGRNPGSATATAQSRFGRFWAYRQIDLSPIEQAYLELDETEGNHDMFFYQKADFIKFRELRLNYTLPAGLVTRFGASAASLYIGARNLATWTDYLGLDPEINGNGARDEIGTNDAGALAPPRMVFSGVRVTF